MKVGLVARSEDRGLGIMSWEIQRHLIPERTLVIDMGALGRTFPMHPERFPGATTVPFLDGTLPETACREWLTGLDVVMMLETSYDERFIRWARDAGVRSLLFTMPEFFRADLTEQPDAIWNPTSWRHGSLPAHARVVPVPVATDRFDAPERRPEGPIRVLHNAGHRAAMDRNGTQVFLAAMRALRVDVPVDVVVSGQDGRLPVGRQPRNVTIRNRPHGSADYWQVPAGFDLLVMPRRYGGLCLPVQEGMAAGAVPVMPDCSPNMDLPVVPVPCRLSGFIQTPGGEVGLSATDPAALARAIGELVECPEVLAGHRARVLGWAREHSWAALMPVWREELAGVLAR